MWSEKLGHIALIAFFGLLISVGLAHRAAARDQVGQLGNVYSQSQYRHEGNRRIQFAVTCASETWTVVLSSEPRSRSFNLWAVNANTYGVCLSSTNASDTCADGTAGPEIQPGAFFADYGTYEWYCRSRADNANEDQVKGYRAYHDQD